MTDKTQTAWIKFFKTSSAVVKVLLYLIQDLAPVIGYDEANRLVGIIGKAQEGDTE